VDRSAVSYLTFGIVLILAVVFDLGLLSRKGTAVSMKKALSLTLFWVSLAMLFFVFLWLEEGRRTALEYLSAYVMEWSLSVDNIFVFILIFTFFCVKPAYYARVLLIGILVAIFLRIVFITAGIVLVNEAHWVLYIGGVVLIISGARLFITLHDAEPDIEKDPVYRLLRRFLPLTGEDGGGRFVIVRNGRKWYTSLFVVVVLLATTDVVFAVDSIPAVFGITQEMVVIFHFEYFCRAGSAVALLPPARGGGPVPAFATGDRGITDLCRSEDAGGVFRRPSSHLCILAGDPAVYTYLYFVFVVFREESGFMSYTIRHIAGIVDGEFLRFRGDDPIEHLLLDSRRLIFPATSLFFSLRGPRRDGMAYLEELYRRGVRNFVVSGSPDRTDIPEANIIKVADTLAALQELAAFHRAQYPIPVIAITGSNGKTIVKEWLNELLEPDYSIVRSPKSYNSQTGVPLSVWAMAPGFNLAIFEAGISRPGEMEKLGAILAVDRHLYQYRRGA